MRMGELSEAIAQRDEWEARCRDIMEICRERDRDIERCAKREERLTGQRDALGELLRDCLRLLDAWDRANWEELPEFAKMGEEYEPEGNHAVIIEKARRLGVEVR